MIDAQLQRNRLCTATHCPSRAPSRAECRVACNCEPNATVRVRVCQQFCCTLLLCTRIVDYSHYTLQSAIAIIVGGDELNGPTVSHVLHADNIRVRIRATIRLTSGECREAVAQDSSSRHATAPRLSLSFSLSISSPSVSASASCRALVR